jgi:hypothetical protein
VLAIGVSDVTVANAPPVRVPLQPGAIAIVLPKGTLKSA